MGKVENREAVYEDEKMGYNEVVGVEFVKELEKKEDVNEDIEKVERVELSPNNGEDYGQYSRKTDAKTEDDLVQMTAFRARF